jgi:two-component system, cell cycle response regulator
MPRPRSKVQSTGHVILVVDDDLDLLSTTSHLFSRLGHQVITAKNGAEALELCRREEIHLMLLDYFMPGMTGEAVVRAVRSFDQELQIVLQTGYASERPALKMLEELDIQGYHDKSEGPEKLLVWASAALKAYRRARALRGSRDGLAYLLRVTPEMHRLQPLDDLMLGILTQLQGLLGLSGAFIATVPEDSLLATLEHKHFHIRVATGRFHHQSWQTLADGERDLVKTAATSGRIQMGSELALPLVAAERVVGVILVDQVLESSTDLHLLELFANQAAVAIENAQLFEHATVDDLTRLNNRRYWFQQLDNALRLALRHGQPLSVLLLDIDHFKTINDTYGHPAGDQVLATLGRAVSSKLRKSDVPGRYGGEEFAVLLPHTDMGGALIAAENVRKLAEDLRVSWEAKEIAVRLSIGVGTVKAVANPAEEGIEELLPEVRSKLLRGADLALYHAKERGRNRVETAEPLEVSVCPVERTSRESVLS